MNPWNTYRSRINAHGITKRDSVLQRERAFLSAKLPASLSYHQLTVNGTVRNMAVINSDNLNLKTLCTMPGEDLPHGGLVEWMGNHWLITEKDANNELYTKGTMKQCNYLLRWIAEDDTVVERWCVIEDGTKYLTGEYGDNDFIVVRGDSRISLTLAKDEYSIQLNRNNRFLIDDYDSKNVLAYRLTKPFKLGGSYNGEASLTSFLRSAIRKTAITSNFILQTTMTISRKRNRTSQILRPVTIRQMYLMERRCGSDATGRVFRL